MAKTKLKEISANIKGCEEFTISGKEIEIEVPCKDGIHVGVVTLCCDTFGILDIVRSNGEHIYVVP